MATKKKAATKAKEPVKSNLIAAYKPQITHIALNGTYDGIRQFGGWNEKKKVFGPLQFVAIQDEDSFLAPFYALDNLALAMEAGIVDGDRFVQQIFATREDFEAFCEDLRQTDTFWMNDRHFRALECLLGEEGNVSYAEAGESLEDLYPA